MSTTPCLFCGGNGWEGSDCANVQAELEEQLVAERALADKLARALTRMLRLHNMGTWQGRRPDESAREILKKWKEVRNGSER